eukprot:4905103-Heterocapsa_arctica.AAC.1
MASFNNLRDDWMGVEELVAQSIRPGNTQQGIKTTDSPPPSTGFASHPFSVGPLQPFTPLGRSWATTVSPTLTCNDANKVNQHSQNKTTALASLRVNLD